METLSSANAMPEGADLADPRVADYVTLSGRTVARVEPQLLASPAARELWLWWRAAARGAVPDRASFDIADHPALAAHLYLIERVPGGFRLRLAGEAFERMFNRRKGHEWPLDSPTPLLRAFAGYFSFVVERAEPYHSVGRLKCEWSDWFRFESLLCPLRHDRADQLLGVVAELKD